MSLFDKNSFDESFGEGAFEKVYGAKPMPVKIVIDKDDVTLACGDDSIVGKLDNELFMNILSMISYHASSRLSSFLSEDLSYSVEILTVDFNTVAKEADMKWVDDSESSLD